MDGEVERPLLRFRAREPDARPASGRPQRKPFTTEDRAAQRKKLAPKFDALERAVAAQRISTDPRGFDARPEHVVVFELARGNVEKLFEVARQGPVEWLFDAERAAEDDEDAGEDDGDDEGALQGAAASTYLYLMFTSVDAMGDLFRAWRSWKGGRLPDGLGYWGELFELLRDVRRWGRDDRLREYGMEARWKERMEEGRDAPFEVELWFRSSQSARDAAARRVREAVALLEGHVEDEVLLEGIALHVLLVRVNSRHVVRLLGPDVSLLQLDDVHRFRTMTGPTVPFDDDDEPALVPPAEQPPPPGALREPLVALLDGLPMQNHAWLAGRIDVLDVHGLEPGYAADKRRHGTAMASLIVRGDMEVGEPLSLHRLFVVPVLAPDARHEGHERAPARRLWLDVVRQAIVETLRAAPTVCVFNLSLGDQDAALIDGISPFARMLDWLAWEHRVLFVVSAGNCTSNFDGRASLDPARDVLREMWRTRARRRVLPPAEAIQVLTVGATPHDATNRDDRRRHAACESLLEGNVLPAPYCCNGPGFLRAVKPDVFAPGGRGQYWRGLLGKGPWTILPGSRPPGQLVASPKDVTASCHTHGTSNSAALVSRAAERVIARLLQMRDRARWEPRLPPKIAPLLCRALLIHSARWPDGGKRMQQDLEGAEDRPTPTRLSDMLGFGLVDVDRILGCTAQRATLYDVGELRHGEGRQYDVPLPECLQSTVALRRVVVTVAWFTPVHPGHRRYRHMALKVWTDIKESPLRVIERGAPVRDGRGTVYHRVFDRENGAIDLAGVERFSVVVRAARHIPQAAPELAVPYAIAVTVETEAVVPLYDQISARVEAESRARVQAGRAG